VPLFRVAHVAVARRVGADSRSVPVRLAAFMLLARAAIGEITNPPLGRNAPAEVEDGMDPMAGARAAAAAQAVMAGYDGQIAALYDNRSMTPEQRRAAIANLRAKARREAAEASRNVMEAEKGAAKARRMVRGIGI
jgi:hypothetical protein